LGLGVDEPLSPRLQQQVVTLGTRLRSFEEARVAIRELLGVELTTKLVERFTERIGSERVAERDAAVVAWKELPLMGKLAAPPQVQGPDLAVVSCDGGRMQLCDMPETASSHWREYKAGTLLEFESAEHDADPSPDVPAIFLERDRVHTLARDIGHCTESTQESAASPSDARAPAAAVSRARLAAPESTASQASRRELPKLLWREVCASLSSSDEFGEQLACRAWQLGFSVARRKAFLGDGQSWNWTIWSDQFKHLRFVPIVDFIHALTYVFAAALAGRRLDEGWTAYERWIRAVWQGRVTEVIAELATRQQELGMPSETDGETSPRRVVSTALTYLQNQQTRMNYPEYRRHGLPITTAHMESAIKSLNRRVKGTEKFWSTRGGEALLQLRADQLSASEPLRGYWARRPTRMSGTRSYSRRAA